MSFHVTSPKSTNLLTSLKFPLCYQILCEFRGSIDQRMHKSSHLYTPETYSLGRFCPLRRASKGRMHKSSHLSPHKRTPLADYHLFFGFVSTLYEGREARTNFLTYQHNSSHLSAQFLSPQNVLLHKFPHLSAQFFSPYTPQRLVSKPFFSP